jgi:hypothetical protein
MKKD